MSTTPPSPMVAGPRKAIVKALLWSRVVWLALRCHRSPRRAAQALQALLAERARHRLGVTLKYARAGGRYFWDFYSPGWPSPAFDRFVERELDRLLPQHGAPHGLQTAIVAVTKRCPLRCEHCCEWQALNQQETLSREDLLQIVAQLAERGVAQILLSGGEPLQRFDDVVAIVAAAAGETDFWLLSSGHGLTAERAAQLRSAGLTGIALSLDHHDPESHDRFRRFPGAFAGVERAAASARGAGLLVALSLCPTRAFVSEENLAAYARVARQLGAAFVQILEPQAVGHYAGQDVALSAAQRRLLEEFCIRLNFDPARRELPAVAYAGFSRRRTGCHGAGERYLYVDTDGALLPCPFCREPAGSVLAEGLDAPLAALRARGCPAQARDPQAAGPR